RTVSSTWQPAVSASVCGTPAHLHLSPTRRSSELVRGRGHRSRNAIGRGHRGGRQLTPHDLAPVGRRLTPPAQGQAVHERQPAPRSEEHTSELQSRENLVCHLLLVKKKHYDTAPLG